MPIVFFSSDFTSRASAVEVVVAFTHAALILLAALAEEFVVNTFRRPGATRSCECMACLCTTFVFGALAIAAVVQVIVVSFF